MNIELKPGSLRFLIDKQWWEETLRCALRFAPKCILPAALVTIANVISLISNYILTNMTASRAAASPLDVSLTDLIVLGVVSLIAFVFGFGLTLWGLGLWLARLTTFARTFAMCQAKATDEDFKLAASQVKTRKGYLAKFWLLASVYLMVPVILLCMLITLKVISSADFVYAGQSLIPLPDWLPLQYINTACMIGSVVLGIPVTAYSLIGIVFSAISDASPWRTAHEALLEALRHAGPVLAVTVAVCLFNVIVSAPLSIIALCLPHANLDNNIWFALTMFVWAGVTSTFVWPASLAPFCKIASLRVANDG